MSQMKVFIEGKEVITKSSGAVAESNLDVCLTPQGPAVVPVAYTNRASISNLSNASKTTKILNSTIMLQRSYISRSSGDEAGLLGGILSKSTRGKTRSLQFSRSVYIEGQRVVLNGAITLQNNGNAIGKIQI